MTQDVDDNMFAFKEAGENFQHIMVTVWHVIWVVCACLSVCETGVLWLNT